MQTQRRREEKTVVIATALGLFAGLLAVGSTLLWLVTTAADWSLGTTNALFILLAIASATVMVAYLVRTERR